MNLATLALVLGLLASALIVCLSFAKSQKSIALVSILLSAVLVGQYLSLNQQVAATLSAMSLGYGLLVYATVDRPGLISQMLSGTAVRISLLGVYTAVFGALNGGFSFDLQLLAYFGSVLMVAVMMVENPWLSKLILLSAGVCWTVFQFQTGAYGNLVGQIFYFGGLGWSSWRLLRIQRGSSASDRLESLEPAVG